MNIAEIVISTLTIIAILAGPVLAVRVTRYLDDRKLKQERRMDVFRTLMRTRRVTLSPDHVGALNLVEIEFQDEKDVISAWRAYFGDLGEKWPSNLTLEELQGREEARSALLTRLLHAMAKALNFEMEQLDIFQGGYAPKGWYDDEQVLRDLRHHLLQIVSGQRAFPVMPMTSPTAQATTPSPNPYPPPP